MSNILNNGKCVSIRIVNVEEIIQIGKLDNPTIIVTFILEGEKWKEFYYYKTKFLIISVNPFKQSVTYKTNSGQGGI